MKPRTLALLASLAVLGCTTAARAEDEPRWYHLRTGLGGNLALWTAPSDLAFEGVVELGVRLGGVQHPVLASMSVELRGSPRAGNTFPVERLPYEPPASVTVSTARLAGGFAQCFYVPLSRSWPQPTPLGCVVLQVGGIFVFGEGLESPGDKGSFNALESGDAMLQVAFGGRLGFELDLIKPLTARLAADFLSAPTGANVYVEQRPVWQSPDFAMMIGGALVASF